MKNRYVLFTNLQNVIVNGVRTNACALLLEECKDIFGSKNLRRRARGYGTDAAMAIFDMELPSIEYETIEAASPHVMLLNSGGVRPLSSGVILKFAEGGPELSLVVQDQDEPLDVQRFEKDPEGGDYEDMWRAIYEKTTHYWRAPYMPSVTYGPPSQRVYRSRG
jgi:hypothetical protein